MKKCPYCAEEIDDDASVCKYCDSSLTAKGSNNSSKWAWIGGVTLVFAGLGSFGISVFSGIMYLLAAFFVIPPTYKFFTNKTGYVMPKMLRIAVVIILLMLAAFVSAAVNMQETDQARTQPAQNTNQEKAISPEKFGLTTAERKEVYQELYDAEGRAIERADAEYSLDEASPQNIEYVSRKNGEAFDTYYAQYRKEIKQEYGLTEKQLSEIGSEGVQKNWPI